MRTLLRSLSLLAFCGWLAACQCPQAETLTTVSPIEALVAGQYDGVMTLDQLQTHGDLGLGTFDHLNGELILIDGVVYRASVDGSLERPGGSETTPWATVCFFKADASEAVGTPVDMAGLKRLVDQVAPAPGRFVAFRFDGVFAQVKVRSVPRQGKPYPPLAEAVKQQRVHELENVAGTVVGFRCPQFVGGINVPGYHMHFVTKDRTRGGHVLGFAGATGTLRTQTLERYLLLLPGEMDGELSGASGGGGTSGGGGDYQQQLKTIEQSGAD